MARGKPLTVIFENEPNLERVVRAYARLVEQQEGVKLKSITWRRNSTGEVHTTDLVKEGCAG